VFATIHGMTHPLGLDVEPAFAKQYAQMGEPELLKLASSYDTLVEPAQDALRAEFARRKMEPPLVEPVSVLESRGLVTVRRYRDLGQALVPRSVLESAGIYSFLRDENLIRVDWGASNALGGIRLQVRPEDVPDAEQLLSQPMPESIEYESHTEFVQPHCPRCGSVDVSGALPALLVPRQQDPEEEEAWHCQTCGCTWDDDGDAPATEASELGKV
jgi:hypothetical protein